MNDCYIQCFVFGITSKLVRGVLRGKIAIKSRLSVLQHLCVLTRGGWKESRGGEIGRVSMVCLDESGDGGVSSEIDTF